MAVSYNVPSRRATSGQVGPPSRPRQAAEQWAAGKIVVKTRLGAVTAHPRILDVASEYRRRTVFNEWSNELTLPDGVQGFDVKIWDIEANGPLPSPPKPENLKKGGRQQKLGQQRNKRNTSLVAERDQFARRLLTELKITKKDYAKRAPEFWQIARTHGKDLPSRPRSEEQHKIVELRNALRRVTGH